MLNKKPTLAVHKFTSCDGCQLAFLNSGEALLVLTELVDILHFPEYGKVNPDAKVDIAFVEGSITTPDEESHVKEIRANSRYIITIGACATAGGIQALRNFANADAWVSAIYATPQHIKTLHTSTAISRHIKVDSELWGCPVNTKQVMETIRSLLSHATPRIKRDAVCIECKRQGNACVMVTKNEACMGPVTQTGCGALCPGVGRACYGCYGQAENPNTQSLGNWFQKYSGLTSSAVANKFAHINSQAPEFKKAGQYFKGIKITDE